MDTRALIRATTVQVMYPIAPLIMHPPASHKICSAIAPVTQHGQVSSRDNRKTNHKQNPSKEEKKRSEPKHQPNFYFENIKTGYLANRQGIGNPRVYSQLYLHTVFL